MKKLLILPAIIAASLLITSCDNVPPTPPTPDPTYTITWKNFDGTVLETDLEVAKDTVPTYDGSTPIRPELDGKVYTFIGWTPEVVAATTDATYVATYSDITKSYTINWKNDDGTILETDTVTHGVTPTYDGVIPTKTGVGKVYTFAGWTPTIVSATADATYTATYTETALTYTVIWKNDDGTILETDTVNYNTMPVYDGATPTKTGVGKTYTFIGWTPTVVVATENATYVAVFTDVTTKYTITWKNDNGSVLETDTDVPHGMVPTYDGATPIKTGPGKTYTWAGWTPTVVGATQDQTYIAVYTDIPNTYTITWENYDNSPLGSDTVEHDVLPVYTGLTPTKPGDANYNYTFSGWTPIVVPATINTTYVATFTSSARHYNITNVTLPDTLELIDLPATAGAGESVSFRVLIANPDYSFKDILVFSGDEGLDDVQYEVTYDIPTYTATFVMPTFDVKVKAQPAGAVYKLDKDPDTGSFINGFYVGSSSLLYSYARAGDTVQVRLNTSDRFKKPTGVKISGDDTVYPITVDGSTTYAVFRMPARHLVISVLTDDIYRPIIVTNDTTHLDVVLSKVVDGIKVPMVAPYQAIYEEKIYIDVTSDDTNYELDALTVSRTSTGYGLPIRTDENGRYFSMYDDPVDKPIEVKVTEQNMTAFAGAPFLGTYMGINPYGANATSNKVRVNESVSGGYTVQIAASGKMTIDPFGSPVLYTVNSYDADTGMIYFTNSSGTPGNFMFSGDSLYGRYQKTAWTGTVTDALFSVKVSDTDVTPANYKFNYDLFANNSYGSFQLLHNGSVIESYFLDQGMTIFPQYVTKGVEFSMTTGTFATNGSAYTVDVGGTPMINIVAITSTLRAIADNLHGVTATGTLSGVSSSISFNGASLLGGGLATIGDDQWIYTVENIVGNLVTVKLTLGSILSYTVVVNISDSTFTENTALTVTASNPFAGFIFASNTGEKYWYQFTSETEVTLRAGGSMAVANYGTYTYDVGTGVITVVFQETNWQVTELTMTMEVVPGTNNKQFTVQTNIWPSLPGIGEICIRTV